jgi:hypothetical protein
MIVVDDPGWHGYTSTTTMESLPMRMRCDSDGVQMADGWPHELRLPLAPYRFVWRDDPAVSASKETTSSYTEERYRHADGTSTIIREYRADGSFHIMSDRGEIELVDNANNPYAPDPMSVVRLP